MSGVYRRVPHRTARTRYIPSLPGGVVFEQAVGGVLSFGGVLSKRTDKLMAGALSFGGAVTKQTNKVLAGALSFAGALVKQANKTLAGTLTSAGESVKHTAKTIAGTLTSAGTLTAIKPAVTQPIIFLFSAARGFLLRSRYRDDEEGE